mgnify:CR=1 FL=1
MSIAQKIDNVIDRNKNKTEMFSLRKKLSLENLALLEGHQKCNYLIISALTGKNNGTEICMETENGTILIPQEKVGQMLSQCKFKVVFICMPRKKNLAEFLI